jgi:23S rRNA pseudouridine1911/1915/1917 synthase
VSSAVLGERTLRLRVASERAGERLDRYLVAELPGCTRSALRRLILDRRVDVDGAPAAKPGLALAAGACVEVRLPAPADTSPAAQAIALHVVYEDEDVIVVDKPAGLVVHPGHGQRDGTLVNALLGRGTPLAAVGGPARPGVVHRLDRGTSGLLVVAKTDRAHHALVAAFAARAVDKRYLALVWGRVDPPAGTIERAIGRSPVDRLKMSVATAHGARAAVSHYRTLEALPGFSLLEVRPVTGRTHQIRVHLQSLHHPVVGDTRYGGRRFRGVVDPRKRAALAGFDRLALHAAELAFPHPRDGKTLRLSAPLPAQIEVLLRALREP